MRAMRRWAHLSVFLLAATYVAAGLPWLAIHALHHDAHEAAGWHEHGSGCPEEVAVLETLLHGHAHPNGVPQHTHGAAPAISFWNDAPDLQRPADAGPFRLDLVKRMDLARSEATRSAFLAGADPPSRPYSLCILLI